MMYNILRIIIGCIVFLICFLILKKLKIKKRLWYIISVVLPIIIVNILIYIPFENVVVSFSNPEKAYTYYSTSKIEHIIEGKNSSLICSSSRNNYNYTIFPKTDDGYKINIKDLNVQSDTVSINNQTIFIKIMTSKKTTDKYLGISVFSDEKPKITDNKNTVFYERSSMKNSISNLNYYEFYAYFEDTTNYSLYFNEEELLSDVF